MAVKVACDFCDRPLEFDTERGSYAMYHMKRVNTRDLLPHLCRTCAEKLDDVFLLLKVGRLTKADVLDRYAKLNQERREKPGTNG